MLTACRCWRNSRSSFPSIQTSSRRAASIAHFRRWRPNENPARHAASGRRCRQGACGPSWRLARRGGARVVTAASFEQVAELASKADIVQFEFWNHPRLFECLARCAFPAMRTVFWSHISGVSKPLIPPGLMEEAMRFVFTTKASLDISSSALLSEMARSKLAVINSGFGFPRADRRVPVRNRNPAIAYLGTVDFVKMHPGFFDTIDALTGDDIRVSVWGAIDPSGPVAARARAML